MIQPTLYLLFGYPGAGKTTVAKLIEAASDAIRLSSDEIRLQLYPSPRFTPNEHASLYAHIDKQCSELLRSGKSVIYDANLNRHQHREEKYQIAKRYNAIIKLIWVQTDRELAKQRATHASRSNFVPHDETASSMFDRIADVLEPPTTNEKPIVISGSHVTNKDIRTIIDS